MDSFLFIYKNIIIQNYKDNKFSRLCLSNEIQNFLNDICTISDKNTLYQGVWNYIINNSNYPNNIICNKEFIMKQSLCCSMFNI